MEFSEQNTGGVAISSAWDIPDRDQTSCVGRSVLYQRYTLSASLTQASLFPYTLESGLYM